VTFRFRSILVKSVATSQADVVADLCDQRRVGQGLMAVPTAQGLIARLAVCVLVIRNVWKKNSLVLCQSSVAASR